MNTEEGVTSNWSLALSLFVRATEKMVVKVYGSLQAACPQRVLTCLLEKDVEFEVVHVDLESGQHKKPDFILNHQPFGQIPAIEDGDFKLYESRAILRYYAAKYAHKGTNLLGNTLEEKALVDQWLEVEAHNYNDLAFNITFQLVIMPRMGGKADLKLVDICEQKLKKVLDVYEQRLSKSKYLAGESFTLADLTHLPATRYLMNEANKAYLIRDRINVSAWWDAISSRPSWKQLMKLAY